MVCCSRRCWWNSWGGEESGALRALQPWPLTHFRHTDRGPMHRKTPVIFECLLPSWLNPSCSWLTFSMQWKPRRKEPHVAFVNQPTQTTHACRGWTQWHCASWALVSSPGQRWTSAYLSILTAKYTAQRRVPPHSANFNPRTKVVS